MVCAKLGVALIHARPYRPAGNAVVESFFGSLKQERVQWHSYQTRHEAQQDILNYMSVFYNGYRLYSTLGYVCPNDFEKQQLINMKKSA